MLLVVFFEKTIAYKIEKTEIKKSNLQKNLYWFLFQIFFIFTVIKRHLVQYTSFSILRRGLIHLMFVSFQITVYGDIFILKKKVILFRCYTAQRPLVRLCRSLKEQIHFLTKRYLGNTWNFVKFWNYQFSKIKNADFRFPPSFCLKKKIRSTYP